MTLLLGVELRKHLRCLWIAESTLECHNWGSSDPSARLQD